MWKNSVDETNQILCWIGEFFAQEGTTIISRLYSDRTHSEESSKHFVEQPTGFCMLAQSSGSHAVNQSPANGNGLVLLACR